MSEEKTKRVSSRYKSCAESILKKLLPKFITTAAAALGFTFFCLFSHASLEELTEKYIGVLSAFILFLVFIIDIVFYTLFSFIAYRIHKNRITSRGTLSSGRILRSEMVRKRGRHQYFFTVKLEGGEVFTTENYNDDYFKNEDCTECTAYALDGEYIIDEFIRVEKEEAAAVKSDN